MLYKKLICIPLYKTKPQTLLFTETLFDFTLQLNLQNQSKPPTRYHPPMRYRLQSQYTIKLVMYSFNQLLDLKIFHKKYILRSLKLKGRIQEVKEDSVVFNLKLEFRVIKL